MGRSSGRWIDADDSKYGRIPSFVAFDPSISSGVFRVYAIIVCTAFWKILNDGDKKQTFVSWVSLDEIADAMGCARRSVARYVRKLSSTGLITRTRRPGGKTCQTIVNDPLPRYRDNPKTT